MKKITATLGGAVAVLAVALPTLRAASVDSKTASVSATIVGVNALTLAVKNMDHSTATGLTFNGIDTSLPAWSNKASQYVQLSVNDNALAWELRNYTDNFNFAGGVLPSTTTWGYQYGGLKGAVANGIGQRAGLAWTVVADTDVVKFNGPDAGDPTQSKTNGWTFLKDRSDQNPPGETKQSFDGSGGYPNIAFGGVTDTRIVRPSTTDGNEALSSRTAPFYYFLGGSFSGLAPGSYGATITFELLNK